MPTHRLRIDGQIFRDPQNRQVTLHGINIAGDTKFPATPNVPSHVKDHFFEGDDVSFVNRPFPLSDAHSHFSRLRRWGYNTIRYIFTWEALEHAGPGTYDDDFVDFTIEVLRIAKEYGFYIYMDPHQDVWSRFTGGSGAPMWTLYAGGFDPHKFLTTQSSLVQNMWPSPVEFPKMVWATNYQRLVVQTMFTFFFAGKDFAPKCVIDGKNIQDYLQEHFVAACQHLAQKIHDAGDLEGEVVIGYESMNEPNRGHFGHPDLSTIPKEQNLRKWTTPTAFQAMLTGSGRAVEIETWDFGSFGPYKSGTELIDPKGITTWLDPATWDDTKYGWRRDPGWKLGECIWAQHGVWDPSRDELLLPQYFAKRPKTGEKLDQDVWTNTNFMDFYRSYRDGIRSVWPESFVLIQPAPFEVPPGIKDTEDGDDKNLIFASHFYDGITLITKKWNKVWNIDVLGVLRGRYSSPAFAIKLGETAIRNCFRDQLAAIRREGVDNMGVHPCLFTEIGIPYDMDDKYAYKTGDYSSQSAAIDANFYAVEGSGVQGMAWWTYTVNNGHYWGDQWNGEDLSIFCTEDKALPAPSYAENGSQVSLDPRSPSYSESQSDSNAPVTPSSLQKTLSVGGMETSIREEKKGYRAAEAYIRPNPVMVHGNISIYGFDLKNCIFNLNLTTPSSTPSDHPTEIFLPEYHFPQNDNRTHVEASGGKWEIRMINIGPESEGATQQVLRWWHGEGEQTLKVTGVKRKRGRVGDSANDVAPEDSYLETYTKNCTVM
ncbi:glycoside hydrolase family 5 protein [Dothistroma septosporum NZE10]|uniref:Glycoside hydrolase family 5 protein n=1 Tax=Dothistroma septosporum (strain NZE10 / CBS 128990) TaxID=675120 RepID=N1PEQ4_DOTSN|nr:glycoside hydrolase family 5 protein [Dothistroma septosporum NZE10]